MLQFESGPVEDVTVQPASRLASSSGLASCGPDRRPASGSGSLPATKHPKRSLSDPPTPPPEDPILKRRRILKNTAVSLGEEIVKYLTDGKCIPR